MSQQLGRVVSEILNRHFGEIVQRVGDDLFKYGAKPISVIAKSTGLPRSKVIESLRTLIKYDLASFEPSKNEVIADYNLLSDNVLLLIRYPRYLLQIKSRFGSEAELIVEELLQHGSQTATKLIVSLAKKYKDDKERNITVVSLKDIFIALATAGYVQQAPVAEQKDAEVPVLTPVATIVPELDARVLVLAMNEGIDDDKIYWKVHFDRFHQDFRDELMISTITRRIDENAGELLRQLLVQMYMLGPPWAGRSNDIPLVDVREKTRRADLPLLNKYFDQYLKVLEETGCGWVHISDHTARVSLQSAATQLAAAALDTLVGVRCGEHARRLFRLIRLKNYIEEEDIQKHAMLPNKQCKELTYKLMEQHFISVQPMRKAASAGGLVKAIYLYHVKLPEVVKSCRELCYRALHNCGRRAAAEVRSHARLLDKQRRVRSVLHSLRLRQEPEQHVRDVEETITPPERLLLQNVEKKLKQLSAVELELDKALFVLDWYAMYKD